MTPKCFHLLTMALAVLALVAGVAPVRAHEVRPALLRVTEQADGTFEVVWKQPTMGQLAVPLVPQISGELLKRAPDQVEAADSFRVSTWRKLTIPGGINGRSIDVFGLERTITDVLVIVSLADGRRLQTILRPTSTAFTIDLSGSVDAWSYLALGIRHILGGIDHLSFVLGLVLLVRTRKMAIMAITAFTAAHSVTLCATALGFVAAAPAIIEPLVALSIVFVAVEVVHSKQGLHTLTERYPWLVALAFGLLHGFAFASALHEIGLPKGAVALSLLLFNLGVEAGQLIFIAVVLVLAGLITQIPRLPNWYRLVPAYGIGTWAMVWLIQRVLAATTASAA